ncbi:MAG: beta-ketoacyl synthase N-terminal-like domain-containing protein [Pseudoalteromonas prydzensis]|uniref:Beta-ketoacyl synthase n=1 Tax=Pseudoalteromonas prydzensis TaxID=182141 RepID=A0ABR9FL53_9GAMM|nr:beta-ketoacyl synthase N-terminal-like domain-containing protein [Pseudoalteromonas prydzensis]MBE0457550.1 beta-ketoacyl synthase [Pseudoalteromonas prydzensis]
MTLRSVYLNASEVMCAAIGAEANNYVVTNEKETVAFKSFTDEVTSRDFDTILAHFDQLLLPLFTRLALSSDELANTSLFLGSTSLDISAVNVGANDELWLSTTNKINTALVARYGLHELEFTFSTACTASANACLYATRLIAQNKIDNALVIGCEFYNPLTVEGFTSLDLISQTGLATFATGRSGLVLGEGLAALYLSASASEQCQFKLLGGASACDTYSLTMTQEDGSHIAQVITDALEQTDLIATDIDAIKVHGTATLGNDEAECNALTKIFTENKPPIIAFKPFTGHTLGACGVIEIALYAHCQQQKNYTLADYAKQGNDLMWPFYQNNDFSPINTVLLNYFGFGGNNAALVMQRYKA